VGCRTGFEPGAAVQQPDALTLSYAAPFIYAAPHIFRVPKHDSLIVGFLIQIISSPVVIPRQSSDSSIGEKLLVNTEQQYNSLLVEMSDLLLLQ